MVIKKRFLLILVFVIVMLFYLAQIRLWYTLVFNGNKCWSFTTYDFVDARFTNNLDYYNFKWNLKYDFSRDFGGDTAIMSRTNFEYLIHKPKKVIISEMEYELIDISKDTIVLSYLGVPYGNTIFHGNNIISHKDTTSVIWQIRYLISCECPKAYKYQEEGMSL